MGKGQPVPAQESSRQMLAAYNEAFPKIVTNTAGAIQPLAEAQLKADQAVAPANSQLQTDIYRTQAPQLNEIGNQLQEQNAAAQNDLIKGTGKDLVQSLLELDKSASPEYYNTRAGSAKSYQDLLDSINLNGLSGGERAEVERSVNRSNIQSGNARTATPINTVEDAMQFGGAVAAKGNRLAQALDVGSRLMPTFKNNIDVFKVATGQSSTPNSGDARFMGVTPGAGGAAANSLSTATLGQEGQLANTFANTKASQLSNWERINNSLPDYSG